MFGFNGYTEILWNTTIPNTNTNWQNLCVSANQFSLNCQFFSLVSPGPWLVDWWIMQASHWPLSQLWQCVGPDTLIAAWVNIKMLAPIIIKYHFLLSFTHFVVLIASLCLMQTFTLRNKERGKKCRGRERERERESERVRGWGYFIIFSWKLFWLIFDYIWDRGNKEARDEK